MLRSIIFMLRYIIIKIIIVFLSIVFLSSIVIFVTLISIYLFGFNISGEGISVSRNFFIVSLILFFLLLVKVKKFSFKDFIDHRVIHTLVDVLFPIAFVVIGSIILPENIYISEMILRATFYSIVILAALIVVYLGIFNLLNYLENFLMTVTSMDFYLNLFKKIFTKGDIQSTNNNYFIDNISKKHVNR